MRLATLSCTSLVFLALACGSDGGDNADTNAGASGQAAGQSGTSNAAGGQVNGGGSGKGGAAGSESGRGGASAGSAGSASAGTTSGGSNGSGAGGTPSGGAGGSAGAGAGGGGFAGLMGGAGSDGGSGGSSGAGQAGGAGKGGGGAGGAAGAAGTGGSGGMPGECPADGTITYTLSRAMNPSADEEDAYANITDAMDEAVDYYNCYTNVSRMLSVSYVPSVQTADGNPNGSIRFGSDRAYMNHITAMHEISHVLGVGSNEWDAMIEDGYFTGAAATAELREITGNPEERLNGDNQHFWPYGLNRTSEVMDESDLLNHLRMVVAIRIDLGFQD